MVNPTAPSKMQWFKRIVFSVAAMYILGMAAYLLFNHFWDIALIVVGIIAAITAILIVFALGIFLLKFFIALLAIGLIIVGITYLFL